MISIVVPSHNSEAFIAKCVDSILYQTYQDWELVIIDDNSIDNTVEICQTYVAKDKRIIFIQSKNTGVSFARNMGIDKAKGEFICFVDSDDWLEKDALGMMLHEMNEVQMVSTSYQKKYKKQSDEVYCMESKTVDRSSFITALFDSRKIYQGYCWGKLFDLKIIKENNIQFDTELAYNEDRLFVLTYSMQIEKARHSSVITYNYRQHNQSAMSTADRDLAKLKLSICNEIKSAEKLRKLLNGEYPEAEAWLDYNLLKKAYKWQRSPLEDQEDIYPQILDVIAGVSKNVWNNSYISFVDKIKLWKTRLF